MRETVSSDSTALAGQIQRSRRWPKSSRRKPEYAWKYRARLRLEAPPQRRLGLEGIVSKKLNAPYRSGAFMQLCSCRAAGAEANGEVGPRHLRQHAKAYGLQDRPHFGAC